MNKYDMLIACTSWEDRFHEGVEYNLENNSIDNVLLFGIDEFKERTEKCSQRVIDSNSSKIIGKSVNYVSAYDDVSAWKKIEQVFLDNSISDKKILIDVSTMPRYLIWFLLHFLTARCNEIKYCYFTPKRYEECEWLTDEPLQPRLIFKHSGLYLPNRNSILIIQTGFDVGRASQLIRAYEPEKVLLGVQVGEQLDNMTKNIKQHKEHLNYQEIEYFPIDAFDKSHGYTALNDQVVLYKEDKNVVLASFGPKLLAVEMFKLNIAHPETGLVDVPVRMYNEKYSYGADFNNIQYGHVNIDSII